MIKLIIKQEESLANEKKCAETEIENEKLKQTLARNNEFFESLPNREEYNKLSKKVKYKFLFVFLSTFY